MKSRTPPARPRDDSRCRPRRSRRFNGSPAPGSSWSWTRPGRSARSFASPGCRRVDRRSTLGRPDSPRLSVTVPGDASELAFVLFASGRGGTDRTELVIPLVLHPGAGRPGTLVADAGDDQTAVVEHRVTLNGLRSRQLAHGGEPGGQPGGRLAYRWIQVSGPAVPTVEQSWVCIFTPREPGLYRFLLVIAANGEISQPDAVDIWVTNQVPRELTEGSAPQSERRPRRFPPDCARFPEAWPRRGELATTFEEASRRIGPVYRLPGCPARPIPRPAGRHPCRGVLTGGLGACPLGPALAGDHSDDGSRRASTCRVPRRMRHPWMTPRSSVSRTLFIEIARGFRAAAGLPLVPNPEAASEVERSKVGPRSG